MKKNILHTASLVALGLGLAMPALAEEGVTVKVGVVDINPNSSATAMSGPFTPPDALSLDVQSKATLYFGASYDFTDNWQADLVMGIPPKHRVNTVILNSSVLTPEMAATNGQAAAYVTQFAPTAFVNYVFFDKTASFRPFVGLGINYTKFTKAESTETNNINNGGATNLSLTSSKGAAAQIGFSQKITGNWSFFASYATAKVATDLTSDTLGIDRTSHIKFRPDVYTVSVGYSF